MSRCQHAMTFWCAVLWLVAGGGAARAVTPVIKDEAKFFSPDAVKKADKEIRDLYRQHGFDLLVETFPVVPGDQTEHVKAMSSAERGKFFRNWATERSELNVVNGVYILITKEPAHLEIIITPKARRIIDQEAFEKLRGQILRQFRDKHFDEGLQGAVDFVRERVTARGK